MNAMPPEPPYLGQNCVTPYPAREVLLQWLWTMVQASIFRWSPRPWHRWRAWLLKAFGAGIPDTARVVVFPSARVYFPWKLRLAPHSMVGRNVNIYNLAYITLGYGANLSQNCHLCAGTHDYQRWDMPLVTRPIVVGDNAWLGADVFVGPGVTIGELCVVGARSVVVKDIPPRMVCAGNPCHAIKERPMPL
jgi:putative colanic acid biosynthesis acetyltransferase WcaF